MPTVQLIVTGNSTEASTEEVGDIADLVTYSPRKNHNTKSVTDSPTRLPTANLIINSSSKQYVATQPVTDSPHRHQNPAVVLFMDSPTKQPAVNQVTHSPTKQPTQKQHITAGPDVTNSPHNNPTTTPLINSTMTEALTKGWEDVAFNNDGYFLVNITSSPTVRPFTLNPTRSPT